MRYKNSTTFLKMPRQPNGTIMILAPDHNGAGRKAIDLKVTQRFPIFDLGNQSRIVKPNGVHWNTSEYRHLSVPPDLRIHLTKARTDTGNGRHFLVKHAKTEPDGSLRTPLLHVLTFISAPIINYPEPRNSSQPKRTWHQTVIVGLPADDFYAPDTTRVFLDIFVHQLPYAPSVILDMPMIQPNLRLPYGDRCVLGPHRFQDLFRGTDMATTYFSSFRFGYCEMEVDDACYIHCPLMDFNEE